MCQNLNAHVGKHSSSPCRGGGKVGCGPTGQVAREWHALVPSLSSSSNAAFVRGGQKVPVPVPGLPLPVPFVVPIYSSTVQFRVLRFGCPSVQVAIPRSSSQFQLPVSVSSSCGTPCSSFQFSDPSSPVADLAPGPGTRPSTALARSRQENCSESQFPVPNFWSQFCVHRGPVSSSNYQVWP